MPVNPADPEKKMEPDPRLLELWGPPLANEHPETSQMIAYLSSQPPRICVGDKVTCPASVGGGLTKDVVNEQGGKSHDFLKGGKSQDFFPRESPT